MLLGGIALGLIIGLAVGGRIGNLVNVQLRWVAALFLALIVRYGTELALSRGISLAEDLRVPLFASAYALLLGALWINRRQPGISLAFVGTLSNATAILVNGGRMPIWEPSLIAAGFSPADVTSPFHTILPATLDAGFLAHVGPLADIIPVPLPFVENVASVGDLFLTAGLAFFLFATVVRGTLGDDEPTDEEGWLVGLAASARLPRSLDSVLGRSGVRSETGLAAGLSEASTLDRPLVLAGAGPGLAGPGQGQHGVATLQLGSESTGEAGALRVPAIPPIVERARGHPYVRLALNGSFTALWTGQIISLFGDRVHQVALAALVYGFTNSPIALALVFVAATLPNLLLGPIAGTFVDRWDQRETMIVSDILRAAAVLLVPIAATVNVFLAYPLVFAVTSISIFFRPARTAVLPRLVQDDELVTANSAMWLGDTMADIIGYPLAGLFVAFLGTALPLAFWLDAATYLASAILIASVYVPPVLRSTAEQAGEGFFDEMRAGFRVLRNDVVLVANTLQGVAGQFTVGVALAVMPIYASQVIKGTDLEWTATYAFLETGIGLGNLVGGFIIGLVGARLAKGRLVILGYAVYGLCTIGLALTGNLQVAIGLMIGCGVSNMVYVIPSQTLFQERVPADMIGRVVGFRFAAVFGALTLAMAVGGVGAAFFGVPFVLALFGLITLVAGLGGLLVPAVRDA